MYYFVYYTRNFIIKVITSDTNFQIFTNQNSDMQMYQVYLKKMEVLIKGEDFGIFLLEGFMKLRVLTIIKSLR